MNKKIDFTAIIHVEGANPNGDPNAGNMPRTDSDGIGEISQECIKRKIRNRMIDKGYNVYVQNDENHCEGDNFTSLRERFDDFVKRENIDLKNDDIRQKCCDEWVDVRAFGNVFAFKGKDKGLSVGVTGPVTISMARSVEPVEIETIGITKSVNGEPTDGKASDTMGTRYIVKNGVYVVRGAISPVAADKTGFSDDDAEIIKECLRSMFVNDASSARPEGSMEVCKLYWFEQPEGEWKYSSAKIKRMIQVRKRDGVIIPKDMEDYDIIIDVPEDLDMTELDGE